MHNQQTFLQNKIHKNKINDLQNERLYNNYHEWCENCGRELAIIDANVYIATSVNDSFVT